MLNSNWDFWISIISTSRFDFFISSDANGSVCPLTLSTKWNLNNLSLIIWEHSWTSPFLILSGNQRWLSSLSNHTWSIFQRSPLWEKLGGSVSRSAFAPLRINPPWGKLFSQRCSISFEKSFGRWRSVFAKLFHFFNPFWIISRTTSGSNEFIELKRFPFGLHM